MKQASKKMTTKEIRMEGIFEALKVALLRGIKSGGVTLGDYTVFFQVFKKENK